MGMSLLLNQFCISPRGNVKFSNNRYFIKRRNDDILYSKGGASSSVSVRKNRRSFELRATKKNKPVKGVVSCSDAQPSSAEELRGIGIVEFFRGKKLLITGATGFLAKVLVEKILRTMPDVGKIFVLIKAKNEAAAMERLQHEIIDAEVFRCLQQKHGKSYQAFMLSKLVPVVGNLCESNLGLDADSVDVIANQVDLIVHSAANTTFDERYDVALNINTRGPCQMMSFARKCKKIKLFLHVSTAYVNGERQGQIMEMPFRMGDCIARERLNTSGTPQRPIPVLDVEGEMKWAVDLEETSQENEVAQKFKKLGMKR
ncbi:hypothetical protein RJ639_020219 [Escallonia herrerae]|uniref:Fatty acyl-CoA reductase n=1 Tax=Escallonia herrerae TaxID=1293975 RepID=A0AA88V745_9ASTE|nr:hypothetical protein RJ639_020219 [Escallonia herrerae]